MLIYVEYSPCRGCDENGNIVPKAGLEPTSLTFQASVIPLHHIDSLMSPLMSMRPPVYAALCLRGQCRLLHKYKWAEPYYFLIISGVIDLLLFIRLHLNRVLLSNERWRQWRGGRLRTKVQRGRLAPSPASFIHFYTSLSVSLSLRFSVSLSPSLSLSVWLSVSLYIYMPKGAKTNTCVTGVATCIILGIVSLFIFT